MDKYEVHVNRVYYVQADDADHAQAQVKEALNHTLPNTVQQSLNEDIWSLNLDDFPF